MVKKKPLTEELLNLEEEIPETVGPVPSLKPRSNAFTLLLIVSLMFLLTAIYLVGWELRNFYHATFGILSPVQTEWTVYSPEESPSPSE